MPGGGLAGPTEARTRQVEANPLNAVGPFATSRRRAILRSPLDPQSQGASTHVYHALCKVIWVARNVLWKLAVDGKWLRIVLGVPPKLAHAMPAQASARRHERRPGTRCLQQRTCRTVSRRKHRGTFGSSAVKPPPSAQLRAAPLTSRGRFELALGEKRTGLVNFASHELNLSEFPSP
jgi:hypothetical protein